MSTLAFSNSYTGYANVPSIELAEKLLSLVYPNMSGIFYANSGSEANELAIKAARYFWFVSGKPGKTKIISRQEAYHGGTHGGDGDHRHGAVPQGLRAGAAGLRPGADVLPVPMPVVRREAGLHAGVRGQHRGCRSEREGADTVAAVIAEPVHGAGGVIPPDPRLLAAPARDLRPQRRAAHRR